MTRRAEAAVTVRLPVALLAEVTDRAQFLDRSRSWVVRAALTAYLEDPAPLALVEVPPNVAAAITSHS